MKKTEDLTVVIAARTLGIAQPIRMALRGMGLRNVHIATDPKQTVEAFQMAHPDAMVVVVEQVENDNGLSLIRFIRRWEKSPNPRIPIIAASPRAELQVVTAVVNNGGHEFVVLPASGDQLLKKVQSAIQSNRPFIEGPDYVGPDRRRRSDPNFIGPERRIAQAAAPIEGFAAEAAEAAVTADAAPETTS